MTTRLLALLLVPLTALAADPPAARPVATQPAAWHARIQPFIDPAPPAADDEEPGYDPAAAIVPTVDLLKTREGAFQYLLTTRIFAAGLVGGGANRSDQSRAFETLVRQPDARALFLDLLNRGDTVAKLYGLCGLREVVDFEEIRIHVKPFLDQKDARVRHFQFCLITEISVADLADAIHGGSVGRDLLFPHMVDPLRNPPSPPAKKR
jgi:hypothetical protein